METFLVGGGKICVVCPRQCSQRSSARQCRQQLSSQPSHERRQDAQWLSSQWPQLSRQSEQQLRPQVPQQVGQSQQNSALHIVDFTCDCPAPCRSELPDEMGEARNQCALHRPGSLWENGYAESFHSKLVDEFLSQEEFESMREARQLTSAWREDYNEHRPHSSLGYPTPSEYAARCLIDDRATNRCAASAPALEGPALQPPSDLPQPIHS